MNFTPLEIELSQAATGGFVAGVHLEQRQARLELGPVRLRRVTVGR